MAILPSIMLSVLHLYYFSVFRGCRQDRSGRLPRRKLGQEFIRFIPGGRRRLSTQFGRLGEYYSSRQHTHSRDAANDLWRCCQPSCVVSCIYTLCLSFEDVGKIVLARPRYTLHAGRKVERFLVLTPENKLEACCLYMSLHSGHELSLSTSDRADLALYSQVSWISPDTITCLSAYNNASANITVQAHASMS